MRVRLDLPSGARLDVDEVRGGRDLRDVIAIRRAVFTDEQHLTDVVDHDWAKSIYFKDPNGIQLEFCCFTRNLNADDARMQKRAEISIRRMGLSEKNVLPSRAAQETAPIG